MELSVGGKKLIRFKPRTMESPTFLLLPRSRIYHAAREYDPATNVYPWKIRKKRHLVSRFDRSKMEGGGGRRNIEHIG